jgi:fructose 1,6-bisphosphatase
MGAPIPCRDCLPDEMKYTTMPEASKRLASRFEPIDGD